MNEKIKRQMRVYDIKQWELARALGVSARTVWVWFQNELTGERLERVTAAIDNLISGRCDGNEDEDN